MLTASTTTALVVVVLPALTALLEATLALLALGLPLVGLSLGENRKEGFWRGVYGIAYYAIILIVGPLFLLLYAGVWIVDVGWQLLTNREGLGEDNFAMGVYDRQNKLREYIMGGKGSRSDWRR